MKLYRLVHPRHAATAFTGDGARLYGGRWNREGLRAVYTASSRALALLEMLAQDPNQTAPFTLFEAELPDDCAVSRVAVAELPAHWQRYPSPGELQEIGSRWLRDGKTVALLVPSVIVPQEWNCILNPAHVDFNRLTFREEPAFRLDPRLR